MTETYTLCDVFEVKDVDEHGKLFLEHFEHHTNMFSELTNIKEMIINLREGRKLFHGLTLGIELIQISPVKRMIPGLFPQVRNTELNIFLKNIPEDLSDDGYIDNFYQQCSRFSDENIKHLYGNPCHLYELHPALSALWHAGLNLGFQIKFQGDNANLAINDLVIPLKINEEARVVLVNPAGEQVCFPSAT